MPEPAKSKQSELHVTKKNGSRRAAFAPRPAGICILAVIVFAFAAGALRRLPALALAGAAFLLPWAYCFIMTLLLALLHRRRARRAFVRVSPGEISAGESARAVYCESDAGGAYAGKIFQFPGILARCGLLMETLDGRRIRRGFNPADKPEDSFFTVEKRGAYFSAYDEFSVFDIFGFFRFTYFLPAGRAPRILAGPQAAGEAPAVNARAGDSSLKPEFSFQRTDNLVDHRPYVPGDDPRRINWKLFGHGGGLFVREGERAPPPHSNIVILVDTEYDPALYGVPAARSAVDLLCENALAAALACAESGMDVLVGHSGGKITGGNAGSLASALAWPAAVPITAKPATPGGGAGNSFPAVPGDRGIIILALPRSGSETSAIDCFLKETSGLSAGKNGARPVELLFLYDGGVTADKARSGEIPAAAELCAAVYNRRPGVRAGVLAAGAAV